MRKRQRLVAAYLCQSRSERSRRHAQAVSEAGDSRRLEQRSKRQLGAELVLDAGGRPRGQNRIAAEVEEIVVDADAVEAEHAGQNAGQGLLGRVAGSQIGLPGMGLGRGQRVAVELSVLCERELVE